MPGSEALARASLKPVTLSYKEGLALNNGTAQMLATGVLVEYSTCLTTSGESTVKVGLVSSSM